MKKSQAIRIRKIIEQAVDLAGLDDGTAQDAQRLFPGWDEVKTYLVGQRVRYEGGLYRCLQEHTAQKAWTPAAATGLWAKVLTGDGDTIPAWEQPESTNPYQLGDRVRHSDRIWVSIVENNVWEPGVYGWEEEV